MTIEKTEVVTTKKEIEKEEKAEPEEGDKSEAVNSDALELESGAPEGQTGEVVPPETAGSEVGNTINEQNASDPEPSEGETPVPAGEPLTEPESEPESETGSEPQNDEGAQDPAETPSKGAGADAANDNEAPADQARIILDALMPAITVYAAESTDIPENEGETDPVVGTGDAEVEYEIVTETITKTEETVVDGITWRIDAGSSSAEVFSSEIAGAKFVYVPVISGDYEVSTELPRITVNIIAKEEKADAVSFSHTESVAGYNISIDAPAGVFPEGTTVSVNVVSNPVSLIEGQISDERDIQQIITFDITFWHDGIEIEPENGSVNVSLSLASDMKETLQDESAELQVFHIDDDENIEEVACSSNGEEVSFSANTFSEYSVVTTTGNEKTKLTTPTNVHWVDGQTLTLAWDSVDNASGYGVRVECDGEESTYASSNTTSIDLLQQINFEENYNNRDYNGKQLHVSVQATVSYSDQEKYLKYSNSDYSNSLSKVYIRGILIDTETGAHIIQTDAIFDSLKNSLSAEQLANAEGKELSFDLSISDLAPTSEGTSDISNYASINSYTIGKFFDISLIAKADGISIGNVSATAAAVPLAVEIPTSIQRVGRTFIILRNHDGVITEVGRGTGNQVPISTDQFSTYAIAYIDSGDASGDSSGGESSSSSSENSFSNNSGSSSSNSLVNTSTWTPKTPDEIKRYSVVGTEILAPFVDKNSGYTLTLKNAMQGASCYAAFESVLNGYTIGRTYDIFPNGQRVQSTEKEVGFSIEVPKALQKEGRSFQMICVTKGGQPIVLKDLDKNPNTITVKTDKFYAFALVYKDTEKTQK